MGDGDGWTRCAGGHRHWGRFGSAGLLLRAPASGGVVVLLQHRSPGSHHGGTWGLPGGARDSHESAVETALRETSEEVAVDLADLVVRGEALVDDHGGWSYTTVLAELPEARRARTRGWEGLAVRWVAVEDVTERPLHPGLAAAWPLLRSC